MLVNIIKVLLLAVLLVPLVAPPLIPPFITYPWVTGKALYVRVLVEVAFALWLILIVNRPEYRPRRSWVLLALFGFLGASLLSALFGHSLTTSLWSGYSRMTGVVDLAHWCLYALLLSSMFRDLREWRRVIVVGALAGVLAASVSSLEFLEYAAPHLFLPGADTFERGDISSWSFVGNPLFFSNYLCIAFGLTVAAIFLIRRWWVRLLLCVPLPVVTVLIWISESRSSFLALMGVMFIVSVGCLLFTSDRFSRRFGACLLAFMLLIIALVALELTVDFGQDAPGSGMVDRLEGSADPLSESRHERTLAIEVAVQAFKERPVLGVGPSNYATAWGKHVSSDFVPVSSTYLNEAHNLFFETLATTGAVGTLTLGALALLVAWRILRQAWRRDVETGAFDVAMAAILAAYAVMSMFTVDNSLMSVAVALLVGYAAFLESRGRPALLEGFAIPGREAVALVGGCFVVLTLAFTLYAYNANLLLSASFVQTEARGYEGMYENIEQFPHMGNNWRRFIWSNVMDGLPEMSEQDLEALHQFFKADIALAIEQEPEHFANPYTAVILYRGFVERDERYRDEWLRYVRILEEKYPYYADVDRIVPDGEYLRKAK